MRRLLAEMAWPEVARAVAGGATTLILPLGATEQHGPHLPLGTDTFRAGALAERLVAQLPEALVAPALPVGCSDEHAGFAGLLSLDHATLANVIVNYAHRVAAWGIQRLVLLSAHGGNGQALTLAAARLAEELPALRVWIPGATITLSPGVLAVAQADGISEVAVGLHAGEGETSEMLHLHPDLVRMERAAPGYLGSPDEVVPRLMQSGLRAVAASGVLGDPGWARGARGQRYLEAEVAEYRRRLEEEGEDVGRAAPPTSRHA